MVCLYLGRRGTASRAPASLSVSNAFEPYPRFRFFPFSIKHCTSYLVLVGPRNGFELWFQNELNQGIYVRLTFLTYLLIPLRPVRNRALTTDFHPLGFGLGLASGDSICAKFSVHA